jgi:hypothetical protein
MRSWRRYGRTTLLVVIALAVIIAGSLLLKWLGLDPNAFAAVASAAAAIAAFGSARESSSTARDALRALSFATKPTLRLQLFNYSSGDDAQFLVENVSMYPVERAIVTYRLRDGATGTHEIGELKARNTPWDQTSNILGPHDWVRFGIQWPQGASGKDIITVDYWGKYGTTGWRATYEAEWTFSSDGHTSSTGAALGVTSDLELT